MRAAVIVNNEITVAERPDPAPGEGEILVSVEAAGLNGADLLQKAGLYPPPVGLPDDIPGLELAGRVVSLGPGADRFSVGDRVMAIVAAAGQAELAIVPEVTAMAVPGELTMTQAGGVAEVYVTAHDALFSQCGLAAGDRVLVSGAAGGVGLAGVQLAVAAGATVVASVRRPDLRPKVAAFGAAAVDPSDVADHGPYDVVLELVGAPNLATDLASLATWGRIVVIGVGAGATSELDLRVLMAKRGLIRASTLRARPLDEKEAAVERAAGFVLPLLASGKAQVVIEATFPLSEAASAYERFAAGGKLGKIVLEMSH